MSNYDAIIVGAGPSGLSTGALLAEAGKKVLILEKADHIGGRAYGIKHKGHVLDNGVHGIALLGYMEEVYRRVGKTMPEFAYHETAQVYMDGKWTSLMDTLGSDEFVKMFTDDIIGASWEDINNTQHISIKDWVSQRTDDQSVHLFFWHIVYALLGGHKYEDMCAHSILSYIKERIEFAGTIEHLMADLKYGCNTIIDPLAEAITEKGGEIRLSTPVVNVVIEDGKAKGVRIEKGEKLFYGHLAETELIESPIVISTLPIWDLFNIVSEDEFPQWYIDWVDRVKGKRNPILTLIYGLDKLPWDDWQTYGWIPKLPRIGNEGGLIIFIPPYGEEVGQYQGVFCLQYHWNEIADPLELHKAKNRLEIEKIFDLYEEDLKDVFPDMQEHILWKMRHTAPWALAHSPGVVGHHRPSMIPPGVKNFYLVSETISEAKVVGVEGGASVALHCVDKLILGK